jgi:hypothetical protein
MPRPLISLMVLLLCLLLTDSTPAVIRALPGTQGSYKLEFRGAFTGSGNAAVAATSVTIDGLVRDASGNTGNLIAPNLTLRNGRFRGTGTAMGLPIILSGRVDPPADVLRVSRLVCTYRTSQGRFGRIVGTPR